MTTIRILFWLILAYYIAVYSFYFLLVLLSAIRVRRYHGAITFDEFRRISESRLTMPVSLIIPSFNKAEVIAESIRNALRLNHPQFEVIVINDGSTEETMNVLAEKFHLVRIDRFGRRRLQTKEILGVYESRKHPNLVVVEKETGGRADAVNAGVAFARYPLLCIIDAKSFLEKDALLHLARPFIRDSSVSAVVGVIHPSNGLSIADGEIIHSGLPKTLLGMNQEIEYACSFPWATAGLCRMRSLDCLSGALLLMKKSLFEAIGGFSNDAITDDIEFMMRLNRHIHDKQRQNEPSRLVFAPDAVCYTEIPEKLGEYAAQRRCWQRGTLQAVMRNAGMFFNPRFGLTGILGMPSLLIFEAIAPLIELYTWILMIVILVAGVATIWEILALIYLAYVLSIFLSLSAVLLTESTRLRTASWHDFWRLILAIFSDNLGLHQFHLLMRVIGSFEYFLPAWRDLGVNVHRISHTPRTA